MPHKQYFAGTLLGTSSCASYVSRTHDAIDHKVGQILKLIYLRQYFSQSVDQKFKLSEIVMAILVVYSTSGITSGKKVCRDLKMATILNIWNIKYSYNLTSDIKRPSQIMPKEYFYGDDVIDDVTGWAQSFPPYSCLVEVVSGSKMQGQRLVNKCKYRNRLSRLFMWKENLYE